MKEKITPHMHTCSHIVRNKKERKKRKKKHNIKHSHIKCLYSLILPQNVHILPPFPIYLNEFAALR